MIRHSTPFTLSEPLMIFSDDSPPISISFTMLYIYFDRRRMMLTRSAIYNARPSSTFDAAAFRETICSLSFALRE